MKIAKIPIIDGDKLTDEALDFLSRVLYGFDVTPGDGNASYLIKSTSLTPDNDYDNDEVTKELRAIWDKINSYAFFMVCFHDDYRNLEISGQIEET